MKSTSIRPLTLPRHCKLGVVFVFAVLTGLIPQELPDEKIRLPSPQQDPQLKDFLFPENNLFFFFFRGRAIVCEILSQLTHQSNQILLTIYYIDNNARVTCLSSENSLKVYLTLMIRNCSGECSISITKLIRNSKQTSKTSSHLTNLTKMSPDMDIFPSLGYPDVSEILENEKSIRCRFKVSFIIAKIVSALNRNQGQKKSSILGIRGFLPRQKPQEGRGLSVPSPLAPWHLKPVPGREKVLK